jgi:hypothetical protein
LISGSESVGYSKSVKQKNMKTNKYKITRYLNQSEYPWLDEETKQGAIMYDFHGCTYGCIGDGIALTFDSAGGNPFIEIPYDAFEGIN